MCMILKREFYLQDTVEVAKQLLGKILVHQIGDEVIRGRIVETEAYLGVLDKAAHSYGNRRTKRTETMFCIGGTTYIYLIYGMYHCFNVVTKEQDVPEAVLIRAVEPMEQSFDAMSRFRYGKKWSELTVKQQKNLTNGPGKTAMAYHFDKTCNRVDLTDKKIYIEHAKTVEEICTTNRIGIDYAQEAVDWPLRFYEKNNPYVSVVKNK